MNTQQVTLRDADEIEEFFVATSGMKPDFLQLSAGPADLYIRADDLDGVTHIWNRMGGRTRWRGHMVGEGLHLGLATESAGPLTARGRGFGENDVQAWIAGKELDYVFNGPLLTLEIAVEADLLDELGWACKGEPHLAVNPHLIRTLKRTCQLASARPGQLSPAATILWRDD